MRLDIRIISCRPFPIDFLQEFDTPLALLQNPDGILSELVSHTDKGTQKELRQLAEESVRNRQNILENE